MKEFGAKQNIDKSPADLLYGFFKFYSEKFDTNKHVISIAHRNPFLTKNEYRKELKKILSDPSQAFILEKMNKQTHFWAFTIADPFDRTYNPAK